MKKLIILAAVIFLNSCGPSRAEKEKMGIVYTYDNGAHYVIVEDGCEYVIWYRGNAGGIVHKQNCKNH